MLKLTAEITGRTVADLELALQEVQRLVSGDFTSGANSNDTGGFSFNVSGEEEVSDAA